MRDPGLAAVLSAIIPGVGQFYNGRILAGILWLIITPGLWIGTGGLLGWVCHVIAAYTAYTYARDHRGYVPEALSKTVRRDSSILRPYRRPQARPLGNQAGA
jgi:TM2 domain-containing membrane protein YozV